MPQIQIQIQTQTQTQTQSQTQSLILAAGAFQGALLFALLVSDMRVNYASKLLGVLCLLIATALVLPLIVASGDGPLAWLIGFLCFCLPVIRRWLLSLWSVAIKRDQAKLEVTNQLSQIAL
ncbi:hypothetical protein [Pseudidiomarina aestuarii]|uniref:hypothetical protein n=1 Tax=Pseudidiomarina aestuarii TaxID=624146 RepID=UPI00147312A3|nr:hypothetical protein [Pseudidiomarina aestuarii]